MKKEWIIQAINEFNDASKGDKSLQLNGRPIVVEALLEETELGVRDHWRSGSMIREILDGGIQPTIASPADRSWLLKLKEGWSGDEPIVKGNAPDLAQTPLVLAMWESRARALGCWPKAGLDCTWQKFRELGISLDGWGTVGHPKWGRLKYGYGMVGRSNSATFIQVANCMSGLGKTHGLTVNDVRIDTGCG